MTPAGARGPATALLVAASVAVAVLTGGCSATGDADPTSTVPVTSAVEGRRTYVSLGGEEALGFELEDPLRDAWPQQVYDDGFATDTAFVNLATPGDGLARVLDTQVPAALELMPTTATVWVGAADVRAGTPPEEVGAQTTEVVEALLEAGVGEVVVVTSSAGAGAALADVVRDAARAAGATTVEVSVDPAADSAASHDRIAADVVAALDP